jgi:hypothetical protein
MHVHDGVSKTESREVETKNDVVNLGWRMVLLGFYFSVIKRVGFELENLGN